LLRASKFLTSPGKATTSGINYRPEGYPCSATLVRQFQALSVDLRARKEWEAAAADSARLKADKWESSLLRKKEGGTSKAAQAIRKRQREQIRSLRNLEPKIHFGTVASGSLVIASAPMRERLLKLHGKIAAAEMEGAGVLGQTFTYEIPTPAILVKGISDYADPGKSALDSDGYWRQLACENSIRLALAVIKRGRIRPQRADQFTLDATLGPIETTRAHIPDPASPGHALVGFPALVLPRGPITALDIEFQALGADSPATIHKVVISHVPFGMERTLVSRTRERKVSLGKLSPEPVGIYLLLSCEASIISFAVRSPAEERTIDWRPMS
jgi:Phosphorylase superfamily